MLIWNFYCAFPFSIPIPNHCPTAEVLPKTISLHQVSFPRALLSLHQKSILVLLLFYICLPPVPNSWILLRRTLLFALDYYQASFAVCLIFQGSVVFIVHLPSQLLSSQINNLYCKVLCLSSTPFLFPSSVFFSSPSHPHSSSSLFLTECFLEPFPQVM